jgi:hypothetical protein
MNRMFGTAPIGLTQFSALLLVSSVGFIYLEISKKVRSQRAGVMA